MTKIQHTDTFPQIIGKLAGNNRGASKVCFDALNSDAERGPLTLLALDTLGIYGGDIWKLYKDECKQNLTAFIDTVHAKMAQGGKADPPPVKPDQQPMNAQLGKGQKMSNATKSLGANVERQPIVESAAPARKTRTRKANYVWVSGLSFEVFHTEEEAKAKRRAEGRGDVVKYSRWAGKTGIPACVIVSAVEQASIRASNLGTTPSYGDVCSIVQQGGSIDVIRRQINSAYAAYNRVAKSKGKAVFAGVPVLSQELGDFDAGMGEIDDDAFADALNDELDDEAGE